MLLALILLSGKITPQSIPDAPIVCTSSMDMDGKIETPPCLAPNTGNIPDNFIIPEADRN
jgi:hypothetical protein